MKIRMRVYIEYTGSDNLRMTGVIQEMPIVSSNFMYILEKYD
jgi:hypothetical protein